MVRPSETEGPPDGAAPLFLETFEEGHQPQLHQDLAISDEVQPLHGVVLLDRESQFFLHVVSIEIILGHDVQAPQGGEHAPALLLVIVLV